MTTNNNKDAITAAMQTTDLAKLQQELGISQDIRGTGESKRGLETMTHDDIQMPRLALSQALSPQIQEGDPKRIEGLTVGNLFNDLTGEIYGKGPLMFAVVRRDPPRGVEFSPIEEGGGILDMNVPLDDPRMKFSIDAAGKRVKPRGTKFFDFVIILIGGHNVKPLTPVALSFKGGALKVAKQLNGFIAGRQDDLFKGIYTVHVDIKQQPKPHYVYVVKNAGKAADGTQLLKSLEAAFNTWADKELNIPRDSDPNADPDAFDTEAMEANGAPPMV